jgi:hypothetical protein
VNIGVYLPTAALARFRCRDYARAGDPSGFGPRPGTSSYSTHSWPPPASERHGDLSGVNYFFGSTTTISPYRIDSSLLLPSAARCLMKNVTRPNEGNGWQIEGATERDNQTGTD